MASRTKALPAMPGLPAQLETIELDPADLIRVSGHNSGEPYGASLKRIGGHAGLTGASSYTTTKKWSTALHGHADQVDGFLYMSRHKNDEKAVVLFERAAGKLHMRETTPLHAHPEFGQVGTDLGIKAVL